MQYLAKLIERRYRLLARIGRPWESPAMALRRYPMHCQSNCQATVLLKRQLDDSMQWQFVQQSFQSRRRAGVFSAFEKKKHEDQKTIHPRNQNNFAHLHAAIPLQSLSIHSSALLESTNQQAVHLTKCTESLVMSPLFSIDSSRCDSPRCQSTTTLHGWSDNRPRHLSGEESPNTAGHGGG